MILADAQWRDILAQLTDKDKFGFKLIKEDTDKAYLTKRCEIGGVLSMTYVYADGDKVKDDVFQFTKGSPPCKYARIVPSSVQQIYGAVKVMESLV